MTDAAAALQRVEGRIRGYGLIRATVAHSGGVDSSVVVAAAARALGSGAVTAVTAVSPSLPRGELEGARRIARDLGVRHRAIETHEVERDGYARNDAMRCFHCKTELYATLTRIAELSSDDTVVLTGANADDATERRPGLRAGEPFAIRSPLLEEGIGKAAVRGVAASLGLSVADKPALACLSSRVAYGIRITQGLLVRIDRAESAVRALGFDQVRVRHFGDRASIEVDPTRVGELRAHAALASVVAAIRALGWSTVEVAPDGYRPGRMNLTLLDGSAPGSDVTPARSAEAPASAPRGSSTRP